MPCDYSKYPRDWKEIRKRILERDNHCCKVCKVKNKELIFRGFLDKEEVFQDGYGQIFDANTGEYWFCDPTADIVPLSGKEDQKAIRVVLTIAHLNHDTNDNRDENLAALCQLHHLRHDSGLHKANTRKTNEKKKGLQSLFKT